MDGKDGVQLLRLTGYEGSQRFVVFVVDPATGTAWYMDETPGGSSLPPGPLPREFDSCRWILWDMEKEECLAEDTGVEGAAGVRAKLHEMRTQLVYQKSSMDQKA